MNLRFVSVSPDRDMAMRISFERRLSVIRLGEYELEEKHMVKGGVKRVLASIPRLDWKGIGKGECKSFLFIPAQLKQKYRPFPSYFFASV